MRLGTCIALELSLAVGAVAGVWVGVGRAAELAGTYLEARPAAAATLERGAPQPLPRAHLEVRPARVSTSVFGASDADLLAPLGAAKVIAVKVNHGGTSLSLRLDFENGARAAFKPEQTHPQSNPRNEIAAYRLDRLLGIGRVPPAKATAIPVADVLAAAPDSHRSFIGRRLDDEAIARDGVLRGELSWWVPVLSLAAFGRDRLDEPEGRARWTTYLKQGSTIPDDARVMCAQIATMIMFDVLIDNPDRWSGANTVMSPDGSVLYFMDNTMSFSKFEFGHKQNLLALERIEMFPRKLVERIRALTAAELETAFTLDDDAGLGPLLGPVQLRAILSRRDNLLRYIDGLIAEHGEAAVLAFP